MVRTQINADRQDKKFKYKELTAKIIEVFYQVYNKLGYGLLQKIYQNALMIEFKKEEIPARAQPSIKVYDDDGEIRRRILCRHIGR